MNRKAFLLGFYATGSQVLLLRELVSSLNGDELFIGTAFFGWLIAVAAGAFIGGGAGLWVRPGALFACGAALLPLSIIVTRVLPLAVTEVAGEVIPFSPAALMSCGVMLPVGAISGWLFPSIAGEGHHAGSSVVRVYLFEGIGAFVGGIVVLILVGRLFSTFETSVVLGIAVVTGSLLSNTGVKPFRVVAVGLTAGVLFIAAWQATPHIEAYFDRLKYRSYGIERSFDTHYGHQTVLSRDGSLVLLSDNTVEAVHPDLAVAENLLIPPLAYKPTARRILFIGRTEFGIMQLADSLPALSITAVDPRSILSDVVDDVVPSAGRIDRIEDDPVAYLSSSGELDRYDIIVINVGELDNYKNSRLLTSRFLRAAKSRLTKDGIVYFPARYDTDRYVAPETKVLLTVIANVFKSSFDHVKLWPGDITLVFASDAALFDIPYDSIISRVDRLDYSPRYINEGYLGDRLNEFKVDRLLASVSGSDLTTSVEKPVIVHYQALYRAKAVGSDEMIISLIQGRPVWLLAVAVLVLLFFVWVTVSSRRRNNFGLFLYFTAGLASLSLELLSFYVYQSSAGSLYSEMAILIGVFMLGLALGAYYSQTRIPNSHGHGPLAVLLAASVVFLTTHQSISSGFLLLYHLLFLLIVATATGSLFVAATRRYYPHETAGNRGSGYACELLGSSAGALFTTTILLPAIGLTWLLISLTALLGIALLGSVLTSRGL